MSALSDPGGTMVTVEQLLRSAVLWSWSSVTGVMLRYVSRINCDYIMLNEDALKNLFHGFVK